MRNKKTNARSEEKGGKGALVPRLRFPEFQEAGEWEISALSQFVKTLDAGVSVNSGDRPASNGEVGILKTSCVTNGVFENSENKVVLEPEELKRLKESVGKNTIIISRMNTPALVGANAYIEADHSNIFLPDRLWAAKPRSGGYMRFIAHVLGSDKGRMALSELATGTSGSMKNITKSDVLALKIAAPSFLEQQKIADCLSSLDELITAETQKLDTLKTHKKGLMQQLFPGEGESVPRLRFPEFWEAGGWGRRDLRQVGEIVTGKTPSTNDESLWNGDIQFVTPTDISDEKYQWNAQRSVVGDGAVKALPKYSTMFTCIASIGKIALSVKPCITNQQINTVIPSEDYENEFVYYSLLNIVPLIRSTQANTTLPIINKTDFSKFKIPVPTDFDEQQKIADCLSSLDELITAETQKLNALKTHKKGLMQQLFPVMDEVQG